METKNTKLWHANYKKCIGIEFQLHSDTEISAFDLNISFGGVKCHAILSSFKTREYTFDLIACFWIRSHKVHIPYKVYPETLLTMIAYYANYNHGYVSNGGAIKLKADHTNPNKTTFSLTNNPFLKLKSKYTIHKLAFIISDGFFCNNYIHQKDKYTIDGNIKDIKFCMMNRYLLNVKAGRYFEQDSEESIDWFPSISFVKKSAITLPAIATIKRSKSRNK